MTEDKPKPTFDSDSLLSAIDQLLTQTPEGEGLTTEEISEQMQLNPTRVRFLLRKIKEAGRLGTSRRFIEQIDGSRRPVPTYFVLPEGD